MVGVNDSNNAEAGKLNEPLVGVSQTVTDGGPHSAYHWEVLSRYVTAAVRGGLKGRSLNGDGEEVEVIQEGSKTAFSHNRTWKLLRYLLQRLQNKLI